MHSHNSYRLVSIYLTILFVVDSYIHSHNSYRLVCIYLTIDDVASTNLGVCESVVQLVTR